MVELIKFIDDTLKNISDQVPGFISVALVRVEEGSLMAHYPKEKKKELELTTPFYLNIFNNAVQSLETVGDLDGIKEIIIETPKKLFYMASKSQKVVGIVTLDVSKANLGLTRKFASKGTDEVFNFLRKANLNI